VKCTDPLFVVVIMALASTRPVITFTEGPFGSSRIWGRHAGRVVGRDPDGGSDARVVRDRAGGADDLCPVLARQLYDLDPSLRLKYATLGLLFVNVSIGPLPPPICWPLTSSSEGP
jgi:hypothetical protein